MTRHATNAYAADDRATPGTDVLEARSLEAHHGALDLMEALRRSLASEPRTLGVDMLRRQALVALAELEVAGYLVHGPKQIWQRLFNALTTPGQYLGEALAEETIETAKTVCRQLYIEQRESIKARYHARRANDAQPAIVGPTFKQARALFANGGAS